MNDLPPSAGSRPVFRKCPRCEYSLRGLPANHVCPECGLRFDDRCELYRVINPRQVLVLWLIIISGGWMSLTHLPDLLHLSSASAWDMVAAFAGVLWIVFVAFGVWFFVRRYRRGFEVAIVSDGLIVRLPGFSDDLIPWSDIGSVSVKDRPEGKQQVVCVCLKSRSKTVEIGHVARVFPTRADAERFASQVQERLNSGGGQSES